MFARRAISRALIDPVPHEMASSEQPAEIEKQRLISGDAGVAT
jgi:hypothetical protein